MRSSRRLAIAFVALFLFVLLALSFVLQLRLPAPTGPYAVGRTTRHWVDNERPEALSATPGDLREAPVIIWYPAQAGTGRPSPYFPDLQQLAPALRASGEVTALEAFGLRFIRSHERMEAQVAEGAAAYPVILLSPGNGTNVQFYAALAGELASHGYVVVGLNHPYDVAAVALRDGRIAQFVEGPLAIEAKQRWNAERIAVRTEDALLVLQQLQGLSEGGDELLSGRIDLSRVAVMGHSLGGITAAQTCTASAQFRACLNLDGLQRGGPFSADDDPAPPQQPFMMITKEESLHPVLAALFAAAPSGSYRAVVRGASHDNFTDGPQLMPSLLPLPNRADAIAAQVQAYALAFFEQTLRGRESALLQGALPGMDVLLEVYPAQQTVK